ncbi:MAG TPA: ABC transporter permease [Bryobacteraceae bacterium]|nr:ABC transporter permease [Bryobacteraceae bacterium]
MFTRRRRKRSEEDFAEEIRAHLELEQGRLEREGLPPGDAREAARRAFGNVASAQERYHESARWAWGDYLLKDLRYALRMLRKSPWFTAAAILILAFATGANLAVFRVIDALMLRSIPVSRPEELVRINPVGPQGRLEGMPSTVLDALRREPVFSGVCGFTTPRVTTNVNGSIASTGTLAMTGDCFQTLGVRTQIGRPFTDADDLPEAPNVAVITARLWRKLFGASTAVLGKQIQAGPETFTVIGVAADNFTGILLGFEPGLIIPLHHTPGDLPNKRFKYYWVSVFARRAPGVSQAAAAARIAAITPSLLEQSVPLRYNQAQRRNYLANHLVVTSARTGVDWMLRDRFGPPLFALFGTCAAILLIACLNLSGLLVARTLARHREFSVRMAIGATPWRVIRPLAMESLLLVFAGGTAAMVFASWTCRAMAAAAASIFSDFSIDTSLDVRVFAALAAALVGIAAVLTVVPAWKFRRFGSAGALRTGSRGVIGDASRAQKVLIGAQVAFTLALVTAGGLFASSFTSLTRLPLGLHIEGVAEAMLSPLAAGYSFSDSKAYYRRLLERVVSVPGVEAASLSSFALYWHKLVPEPVRGNDGLHELRAQTIRISDGFFRSIGVNLRAGEDFNPDRSEPEAIVSQGVVKRLGAAGPGSYILLGDSGSATRYRVIGVAPDLRISMENPRDETPVVYLNFWQDEKEQRYPTLFVKGIGGRTPDAKALDSVVGMLGREYVEEYRTLREAWEESVVEDRLLAYLSGAFALLALALAAVGLFAILSCYVARRTSEIGVRMALGAGKAQIRGLILAQIGPVMLAGVVAGIGLALAAGRVLANISYGVAPGNPILLGAAVLSLAVTATAAAWIPAHRAASIQPVDALRQD